jgi:hypothetical protein
MNWWQKKEMCQKFNFQSNRYNEQVNKYEIWSFYDGKDIEIFLVVTPCSVVRIPNVSEDHAPS